MPPGTATNNSADAATRIQLFLIFFLAYGMCTHDYRFQHLDHFALISGDGYVCRARRSAAYDFLAQSPFGRTARRSSRCAPRDLTFWSPRWKTKASSESLRSREKRILMSSNRCGSREL